MVSAMKYSNKSQSRLDGFIKRFSNEKLESYTNHKVKTDSYMDQSIQKLAVNSIIEGYFPKENLVKDMAIKRVNKTLSILISVLILAVVVSYYFVISCEIKLNDLSKQTVILNNDNEELQNKLDTLKSFNNVDKTMQKNNILQKAGQVIETPEITVETSDLNRNNSKKQLFNYAIGF